MGTALKYFRELLEKIGIELDRKTATSLLILILLLILLPVGLFLIRNQLTFSPQAAGEYIQLGEGGCIKLNKDKKKVVDCATVPLKLVNPFFTGGASVRPSASVNASASPSAAASGSPAASASPSPSAGGTPQIIRVTGNTNVEISAALNQIKGTGGAVYLPAGTYTINNKIELYSNTTLFGDGIDQTILVGGINIDEEEAVLGNDTDEGNSNIVIRDMTIKGHAQGTGQAIKLRNLDRGYVYRVKAEGVNTGILLGFHSGKGVDNVRISECQVIGAKTYGVFLSLGKNNVVDHCTISSGGSDALGIGMEIAVEGEISGNRVISNNVTGGGHSLSFTSGNDTQSDPSWINQNNIVCYNTASGNHIDQIWDQRGKGNLYVGNNTAVSNVSSQGFEEKGGTDARCDIPATYAIPAQPAKPTAMVPSESIFSMGGNYLRNGSLLVKQNISKWFDPKVVYAGYGFSGVSIHECGEIISKPALSVAEGDITYKAPTFENGKWTVHKADGSTVGQEAMQFAHTSDAGLTGNNTFIFADHIDCKMFITFFEAAPCTVGTIPNNGRLTPGQTITFHTAIGTSGPTSCNTTVQVYAPTGSASPSPAASASPSPAASSDSGDQFVLGSASPAASTTGAASTPLPGNILQYRLAESQAGLAQAQWKEFAFTPSESSIFDKLANIADVPEVLAQDSDDNFIDGEDSDSGDQFVIGSATPSGSVRASGSVTTAPIGTQFINTTYTLKDAKPGSKQIWVEYRHPNGTTKVDTVNFDLVDKTPQILGLACNLEVSKQSLKITVTGDNFGNDAGTATTVDPNNKLDILSWNNKEVVTSLKSPNIPVNQGQKFKVKVARADGFESGTAVCAVDKSLISLGAKIFCREPGKFDASNVEVTIIGNKGDNPKEGISKAEEKVTISKDGEIDNLKTQLQVGKNYAISIKAPNSLRRTAVFTAMEGTTEILRPDGTPFILPIGDIAPVISADGQINTLDRAELIRQWRVLGDTATSKLTGDFNRDNKVNSIDWACMQYDFGSSDELIPAEIPGSASDTLKIQTPASDTLFIPISSSSPSPTPVSLLLQNNKILLIS